MLIKFSGQTIDNIFIPSFTLSKGEIVVIQIPNEIFSRPVELKLIDMFSGKLASNNVQLFSPLTYVEHLMKSTFWYSLFPMTVGQYHRKYANKANPVFKQIYNKWVTPKTQIQTLPGDVRLKLLLHTTISWTKNIVFDLAGIDPKGADDIYGIVKKVVESGGAAILLNHFNGFKNDCSTYIVAKHLSVAKQL